MMMMSSSNSSSIQTSVGDGLSSSNNNNNNNIQQIIRQEDYNNRVRDILLQPNVCNIQDFIKKYVPAFPGNNFDQIMKQKILEYNNNNNNNNCKIDTEQLLSHLYSKILIVPNNSKDNEQIIKPIIKLRKIDQFQSISSIIYDCIYTLLTTTQNTTNDNNNNNNNNNILCKGYVISDKYDTTGGKNTLTQRQMNAAIDLCCTTPFFHILHSVCGDDIIRYIFLNTSIYWPIIILDDNNNDDENNMNYWQLTGPPYRFHINNKKKRSSRSKTDTSSKNTNIQRQRQQRQQHKKRKRKKKRKRPPMKKSNLQIQQPNNLQPHVCIIRKPLFYSNYYTKHVGDGILFDKDIITPQHLWNAMMYDFNNNHNYNKGNIAMTDIQIQLCQDIIRRHYKTDYNRILQKYCPLPKNYKQLTLEELGQMYCPDDNVVRFCNECIINVFPNTMWDKDKTIVHDEQDSAGKNNNNNNNKLLNNRKVVMETIRTFITLRRHERIANKNLIHNMRVTHVPWLMTTKDKKKPSRLEHEEHCKRLLSLLRWLIRDYCIPLLRSIFYVTETEFHSKRVLYYRKPIWSLFRSLSTKQLVTTTNNDNNNNNSQYVELNQIQTSVRVQSQQMGLSRLRLVPKTTGVRPIALLSQRGSMLVPATLCKKPTANTTTINNSDVEFVMNLPIPRPQQQNIPSLRISASMPTNTVLANTLAVLTFESQRKLECFGSGLRGMDDFYCRYRKFIEQWKVSSKPSRQKLYFGSVDIKHCYDNIDHNLLLDIINNKILTEKEYIIQKYNVTFPTRENNNIRRRNEKDVCLPDDFVPFDTKIVTVLSDKYSGSIFVDGVNCIAISKVQIIQLLHEHLTSHIVVTKKRHGDKFLLQSNGIPQGSILSSLLCNIYYGEIENRLFGCNNIISSHSVDGPFQDSLLSRMTDDFLLITTNRDHLHNFFATMYRGDKALGVEVNKKKSKVSIKIECEEIMEEEDLSEIEIIPNTDGFPWCGILFNTNTGQIRMDYSRFYNGINISSLTVERSCSEGMVLTEQMKMFVRPRCLPILFDPLINSKQTCAINFYELMVLGAVKTAEYISSYTTKFSKRTNFLSNTNFMLDNIAQTIDFAFITIKNRLKKKKMEQTGSRAATLILDSSVVTCLGWKAFYDVFKCVPNSDFRNFAIKEIRTKFDESKIFGLCGIHQKTFRIQRSCYSEIQKI